MYMHQEYTVYWTIVWKAFKQFVQQRDPYFVEEVQLEFEILFDVKRNL